MGFVVGNVLDLDESVLSTGIRLDSSVLFSLFLILIFFPSFFNRINVFAQLFAHPFLHAETGE